MEIIKKLLDIIKNLLDRFWPTGATVIFGFFLIIYVALGILYFQQGAKQGDLEGQIAQISGVVAKPLPSAEKLQAEYDEANHALAPMTVKAVLDMLVNMAQESGIEVDPDADEFSISPLASPTKVEVGEGNYQVLSFKNIRVQGDYDSVMAFISALDSGEKKETMVLQGVDISQTEFGVKTEEETRRQEFRSMTLAVMDMMADNELSVIPNPMDFADGVAATFMGDNPDTWGITEGFPDNTTLVADKGYTGDGAPKDGYVLYEHDKITATDNFTTTSYISILETEYYYTCEVDGTVRQFDDPDVATATEYPKSEREERRRELYIVSLAVIDMMTDNSLSVVPNPMDFAGGAATNLMGDNPDTGIITEGFPDNATADDDKGYIGTDFPKDGYMLYEHDKISTANTTQFETVSYIPMLTTKYYYTCELDGTVRQFDGPDVATATEYLDIDTVATLKIDIYTKPLGGD